MPVFSRVVEVERTGSTNDDLVAALSGAGADRWPDLSVLVARHQVAGRGRSGRDWRSAGGSLTASVVVRPRVPLERWPWLSLLGGLAVVRAIAPRCAVPAGLKWPNDVVLDDPGAGDVPGWGTARKTAGVLVDVVSPVPGTPTAAVLGLGVNLDQGPDELPVPWATSLAACGAGAADRAPAAVLGAVGEELTRLLDAWRAADGDAARCGLLDAVAAACTTIGRPVVVRLPGGTSVSGTAVSLAADGALVVRRDGGGSVTVAAGDVGHLRLPTV